MANEPQKKGNNVQPPQLSEALIQQMLQTQYQKVLNEAEGIKLRHKELDHNKELSSKYMDIESSLERDRPKEDRKTITRIAYIACGFLIILLAFIGYCLSIGKEQFVVDLIKVALYPLLTFGGYYAGRKSKNKKQKTEKFEDAEMVQE